MMTTSPIWGTLVRGDGGHQGCGDKGVLDEAVPAKGRRSAVLRFPRLLEAVAG